MFLAQPLGTSDTTCLKGYHEQNEMCTVNKMKQNETMLYFGSGIISVLIVLYFCSNSFFIALFLLTFLTLIRNWRNFQADEFRISE